MRLSNVPISFALPTLGVASVLVGFPDGLAWALPLYVLALAASLAIKRLVIGRLGYFDNTWPITVSAEIAFPRFATPLTLTLGVLGWAAGGASIYLVLRWWLWYPGELPVFAGLPILGALVTVAALWLADIVIEVLVNKLLFSDRPPAGR